MACNTHASTVSEQSVKTPANFMRAVKIMFGNIVVDLAANSQNAQVHPYISPEVDSLNYCWHEIALVNDGWFWLNPPFKNTGDWMKKCAHESYMGARVLSLVLASVGSNWYRDFVHGKAYEIYLNGRLTFEGHTSPYPKDLMLLVWTPLPMPGKTIWDWRQTL